MLLPVPLKTGSPLIATAVGLILGMATGIIVGGSACFVGATVGGSAGVLTGGNVGADVGFIVDSAVGMLVDVSVRSSATACSTVTTGNDGVLAGMLVLAPTPPPLVNGAMRSDSMQQETKNDPSTAAAVLVFDFWVVTNRYHHRRNFMTPSRVGKFVGKRVDMLPTKRPEYLQGHSWIYRVGVGRKG